jgi:chemotaxis protein methyltransferase CheR
MALQMTRESRKAALPRENRPEEVEIPLLLEGIFQFYGQDFRQYDPGMIRRRILSRMASEGLGSISQYQHRILRDRSCLNRLVKDLIPPARDFFDPPGFWSLLRRKIVPLLRTYPSSRLWVAGCSSGEEAYSLAILLQEEGLGSRAVVYATELDELMLAKARQGRLSSGRLEAARRNYRLSGGKSSLQRFGKRVDGTFALEGSLSARIVFASHSLATDSSFNEFNVILCRNLLSSFTPVLQSRVLSLLHQSLTVFGYLALGNRESLSRSRVADCYIPFSIRSHLYRRVH